MGTFPITVPYTFATATSPIPLNKLDTDFTTLVTAVNGISSGTYPLASPAIQGGTMSGTITLSGTITGSAGAVNPGTVSTTGSITAGTTITASGSITSGNGDVVATTGKVVAGDVNNYLFYNGSSHGYSTWQVSSDSSTYYDRTEKKFYFNPNATNGVFRLATDKAEFNVSDGVYINGTKITAGGGGGNVTGGNGISVAGTTVSMSGSYTGDFTATGKLIAGGSYPQLESTGGYQNVNLSSTTGFSWNGTELALGTAGIPAIAISSGSSYFKVLSPLVPYATQANFTVISDITEKTDVAALSMSTQRIMSLKPVSFTWINDGFKDSGFIAQDFETVYPQNVHDVDGKKHIGIDMNFYADLVATIQELRTELDALKAKVGA
jgi:hypothetical protein